MLMGDKKKVAALITAKLPGSDAEGGKERNADAFNELAKEPEKPELDEGLVTASEEMISAIHSKDAHSFALALQDFLSMADGSEPEASETAPEEGP